MKILFVDDEPGAAKLLADGVGAAGGDECLAAANAEEAVEIVNREGGIDLLVAEVFMDGIDGFTLHETIRPHLPGLRAIFLAEADIPGESDRSGGWPVLAKPLDAAALADFIASFCAGGQPPPQGGAADPLVGTTIGNYHVETLLGSDRDGNFYHAVQTSIERTVELHALDAARAGDPAEVGRFLADARTKANVHHPVLLSVFEAGQQEGLYFYTSEPRSGSSLEMLASTGAQLQPRVVLQLLHAISEALVHLSHEKVAHEPITAAHVIVDPRMRARLVNIAVSQPSSVTAAQEMQSLAAALSPVVALSDSSQALQQLLFEMGSESVTLRSWNALLYEVKRCASGQASPHSHRLDPAGEAELAVVAAARRARRRTRRLVIFAAIALPLAAAGYFFWHTLQPKPEPVLPEGNPTLEVMVRVPAGEFVFEGKTAVVPDFWIDTHEVSIGQYADFLAWVSAHPADAAALLDGVPADQSLVPQGWADRETPEGGIEPGYHALAKAGGVYEGQKLTLDSPVFGLDWFAANAYAKWKGRRLPTASEWAKAALGADGAKYPWGDEWKLGSANIAAEDGFEKWSPVDAIQADKNPYGVVGMAGNVSEWTSTLHANPGGKATVEVRGGNWSDVILDMDRTQNLEASKSAPTVGFRTVSDHPPQP